MGAEGKRSSLKEDQTEKRNCNEKCDAIGEFNGPRGDFYKNMFGKCPAGRPGTTDKVANVAELLRAKKVPSLLERTSLWMVGQLLLISIGR